MAPPHPASPPPVIVIMGVSGCGKTVVGRLLADRLGRPFHDADAYHPAANVEKMRSGIPLDDADRIPWLAALSTLIHDALASGPPIVLACSALRRDYRRQLGLPAVGVRLVHLDGDKELIRSRITSRSGHFMPASLLDSQWATLERPGSDEHPLVVDVAGTPEAITDRIVAGLG